MNRPARPGAVGAAGTSAVVARLVLAGLVLAGVTLSGCAGAGVPRSSGTSASSTTNSSTTAAAAGPPIACNSLDDVYSTQGSVPISTSATLGSVSATLTGTWGSSSVGPGSLADAKLTASIAGKQFSTALAPPAQAAGVIPAPIAPPPDPSNSTNRPLTSDALCLARFAGQTTPTVLLGLFLGGAHCCTVVRAFPLSAEGLGSPVDENLGNPGAYLLAQGSSAVLVSADNAFAYRFTDYADSAMPIRVFRFGGGQFSDVTAAHADLVAGDAAMWWNSVNNPSPGASQDLRGLVAAWVADECVLGKSATAFATLDQLSAAGKLTGPSGWPSGGAYVQALHSFLASRHYC